jgi:hypothetical protein
MSEIKAGLWIYGVCQLLTLLIIFMVVDQHISNDIAIAIGLGNFIAGVLVFFVSVIIFILQKRELGRSTLLASGLLLVTGVITCSVFPLKLKLMYIVL